MRRQVLVGAVALVLVATALIPAVGSADGGDPLLSQPDGFDRTTFEITVTENGSAEWTVRHSTRLANESERQQFEDFAERFRSEETDLYRNFVSRAERLTTVGSNQTDREMRATGFSRDAYVNVTSSFADRGAIELSFRWHNFAATEGDRVVVSDVFGGTFYIGEDQSLVFVRGPDLAFAQVDPEPTTHSSPDSLARSEMVTWDGEREFGPNRPYVEFGPREQIVADEQTETEAAGGSDDGEATAGDDAATTVLDATQDSGGLMWLAGVFLVLVALLGGAVLHFGGTVIPWREGDGGAAAAETADAGAEAEDDAAPIPDEELLSDSDRVLKLLEENGGRMKQVNIVDETEWSKSKVSMLLSDMEEEGQISKLRVGRENIISIAGEEPEAAGSPFEDEE